MKTWADGVVTLDNGVVIAYPRMHLSHFQFLATEFEHTARLGMLGSGGVWGASAKLDDYAFAFMAVFRFRRMREFHLGFTYQEATTLRGLGELQGGDDSEVLRYERMIKNKTGASVTPARYPWGYVSESVLPMMNSEAVIVFAYI
jgi:hypothetical protein